MEDVCGTLRAWFEKKNSRSKHNFLFSRLQHLWLWPTLVYERWAGGFPAVQIYSVLWFLFSVPEILESIWSSFWDYESGRNTGSGVSACAQGIVIAEFSVRCLLWDFFPSITGITAASGRLWGQEFSLSYLVWYCAKFRCQLWAERLMVLHNICLEVFCHCGVKNSN